MRNGVAVLLDCEVNSLDAKEPVEVAFQELSWDGHSLLRGRSGVKFFKPEGEFDAGAVAVHGIYGDLLVGCSPSSDAKAFVPECEYVIGHNVDFDAECLGLTDKKLICTLAIARRLYPKFKSHALGAMYLELHGLSQYTVQRVRNAHSAAVDVELCKDILDMLLATHELMEVKSFETLYEFSEAARIPTVMPFGKHKGTAISEVPADYKRWLLSQQDVDKYLVKALSV